MQKDVSQNSSLKNLDFLAWRVVSAKQKSSICRRNMAYNLRPRLRRESVN